MRTGELKAARAQAGEMMRAASEAKEEAARMTWSLQRMYAAVTESNAHSRWFSRPRPFNGQDEALHLDAVIVE